MRSGQMQSSAEQMQDAQAVMREGLSVDLRARVSNRFSTISEGRERIPKALERGRLLARFRLASLGGLQALQPCVCALRLLLTSLQMQVCLRALFLVSPALDDRCGQLRGFWDTRKDQWELATTAKRLESVAGERSTRRCETGGFSRRRGLFECYARHCCA